MQRCWVLAKRDSEGLRKGLGLHQEGWAHLSTVAFAAELEATTSYYRNCRGPSIQAGLLGLDLGPKSHQLGKWTIRKSKG